MARPARLDIHVSHRPAQSARHRLHNPDSTGVPRCPACGGDIKPDVVLYEESLDQEVLAKAVHYIRQADLMIIGGTSLVVYPAAGLVQYFRGRHLVVVNKGQVGSNVGADLTIDGPIGQVFSQL